MCLFVSITPDNSPSPQRILCILYWLGPKSHLWIAIINELRTPAHSNRDTCSRHTESNALLTELRDRLNDIFHWRGGAIHAKI